MSLQQFNSSNSRNLNGSQESALAQKKSCCFHSPIVSWCSTAEASRHPLAPRLGWGSPGEAGALVLASASHISTSAPQTDRASFQFLPSGQLPAYLTYFLHAHDKGHRKVLNHSRVCVVSQVQCQNKIPPFSSPTPHRFNGRSLIRF